MPVARAKRRVDATPQVVWALAADPYRLNAWWPGVERVENVGRSRWTTVLRSKRGRAVRADYRLVSEDKGARRREWEQELEGTPFARVFSLAVTEMHITSDGDGAKVALEERTRLAGVNRTGGFMVRRARAKILREALDGLQDALAT